MLGIPDRGTGMSRESSIVESVVRACLLWQTFYHPEEELTLGQLVERSGVATDPQSFHDAE